MLFEFYVSFDVSIYQTFSHVFILDSLLIELFITRFMKEIHSLETKKLIAHWNKEEI